MSRMQLRICKAFALAMPITVAVLSFGLGMPLWTSFVAWFFLAVLASPLLALQG